MNAFAQDVITLKNGGEIQAYVQEIGEFDIKYKKFDNPNGPSYTLKKSEIFMIWYVNGSRDVFVNENQDEQNQFKKQTHSTMDYAAFTQMRRNDRAMEAFLRENDASLYRQFHSGTSLRRSGKTLLGIGLGLTGAGLAMFIIGIDQSNNSEYGDDAGIAVATVGYVGIIVGQVLTITSIPLSAIGGSLKKRAANGYEQKYFRSNSGYQSSLNFTLTGNGVGLALKF